MRYLKLFEGDMVKKTIMNTFLCNYKSDFWKESISIFKSLNFPTTIEISNGSYRGLAYQVLLDVNLEQAKVLADDIINKFPETPLIVISEVMVKIKTTPIGQWQDDDLVEPGRYFDKLLKTGETGIFVYNKN
jgi:hypothetical protein